ncbi:MAG: Qat anti-phage system QueC-like protein QatC [Pseudomonadota bacterium]
MHIYGLGNGNCSSIGHPLIEKIKRLGITLSPAVMDFLTIALAVNAADSFVKRREMVDGWTREIILQVSLCEPESWLKVKSRLEKTLRFLSGDLWKLEINDNGFKPPKPYRSQDRFKLLRLKGLDSVSLFSGGLDSAIGVINLLNEGKKPLLVSYAYRGDKSHQNAAEKYLQGEYSRFWANAYPQSANGEYEISMRTRSINFLALGIIGCYAVGYVNGLKNLPLYVPENGFISLNVPLTPRRIGSLSTRTTHPYFLCSIEEILQCVGINSKIINPYQFQTKGEMAQLCSNLNILKNMVSKTVSCGHWKRRNKQCGCCVPCIIRRAAIKQAGLNEPALYHFQDLKSVLNDDNTKDDLFALSNAISHLSSRNINSWIMNSGPIPSKQFEDYKSLFTRGLKEVESFLLGEHVL